MATACDLRVTSPACVLGELGRCIPAQDVISLPPTMAPRVVWRATVQSSRSFVVPSRQLLSLTDFIQLQGTRTEVFWQALGSHTTELVGLLGLTLN